MPRERLPMRKIRDVLRLHAGGLSKRRIAASLTIGRPPVGDYIRRAQARRSGLAVGRGSCGRRSGSPAVPAGAGCLSAGTPARRLAGAASRTQAARRHPVAVVGRIPRRPPGWLWLQPNWVSTSLSYPLHLVSEAAMTAD